MESAIETQPVHEMPDWGLLNRYFNVGFPQSLTVQTARLRLQRSPKFAPPHKQQRMHQRLHTLAVAVRLASEPCQVAAQFVVHALDVVCMCFAHLVIAPGQQRQVRPVVIRAKTNMFTCRQLRPEQLGRRLATIAQRPRHDLVRAPLNAPPQPNGVFLSPQSSTSHRSRPPVHCLQALAARQCFAPAGAPSPALSCG